MSKFRTILGTLLLILGSRTLAVVVRNITTAIRAGGPAGGFIGGWNTSAAIVDYVLAALFLVPGILLIRRHLARNGVRWTLVVVGCLMLAWGIYASYVLLPE